MSLAKLNRRYDRLWSKAERLIECFLKQQLAALKSAARAPAPVSPGEPVQPGSDDGAPAPTLPPPASIPLREIFIAVQCLKRTHEGRLAALDGGTDELQSRGSSDAATAVAEDISRRLRALSEPGRPDGDDDNSL